MRWALDRLVLTLQAAEHDREAAAAAPTKVDAYIAPLGEALNAAALVLARELRRAGLRVELGDGSFRLKKSFEAADKVARSIVILGEDEAPIRYPDGEGLCHGRAEQSGAQRSWLRCSRNEVVARIHSIGKCTILATLRSPQAGPSLSMTAQIQGVKG